MNDDDTEEPKVNPIEEPLNPTLAGELMACARGDAKPKPSVCGAKTRNGGKCQKAPLEGRTRCKLHGGATPTGAASPHFKHGMYTKVLPKNLKANFDKLMSDPQLLEGRAETSLMQLRLTQLAGRVQCNESGSAWRELQAIFARFRTANDAGDQTGMLAELNRMNELVNGEVNDEAAWQELTEFVEKATRVAEREWKRVLANRQVATVEQVQAIVKSLSGAVLLYVSDPTTRQKIAEHVNRLRIIEPIVPDRGSDAVGDE
jgi:hypothetical protein